MKMNCVDYRPKSIIKVEDAKLKAKTPISLIKSMKNSVNILKPNKHSHKNSHITKLKQSVVQEQIKYPKPVMRNKSTVAAKVHQAKQSIGEDVYKAKNKATIISQNMLSNNSNKTRVRTTEDDENDFITSFENKIDFSQTESSRLMLENNVIKRDTFIDGNFNRKLRTEDKLEEYFNKNTGLVVN
jgi:hypothetical protein